MDINNRLSHLFLEDLQLRLRRREVPVEVEPALADGDALGVQGKLPQGRQRATLALVLPRLGVVGVHSLREGQRILGDPKNFFSQACITIISL